MAATAQGFQTSACLVVCFVTLLVMPFLYFPNVLWLWHRASPTVSG
jgi:hypothetical protein